MVGDRLQARSSAQLKERLRGGVRRLADRFVETASRQLHEDLDDKARRVMPPGNEAGVDPFGADLETARVSLAALAYVHRLYFRTDVFGIEKLPQGRVLLVANHSGQIPLDGVTLATAMALDADPPRLCRSLVERYIGRLPYLSIWMPRVGQVLGTPENARRLLEQGDAVIVFPEGVRGISKPFSRRYQLQEFTTGFMRLALDTDTPIVPIAIIGAEEQFISLADLKPLARLLGIPALPVVPQVLLGMPFPLPTKYRIHFGDALRFDGDADDEESVIAAKVDVVKQAVATLVDEGLDERKAVFW